MLTAFMEQRNIRWGELVGGLLIVCSSIALVSSLWDTLNTIPYFQFVIFVSASAAIFGAGLYTEHRWKLESTSRGILIIATLLVPLNFVAMAATARAGWDALRAAGGVDFSGPVCRAGRRAARVLTPSWRWPLTWAVVGNSGLLLLARHQLSPVWLTVAAGMVVACHGTAIGALVSLRRETIVPVSGDETTPQPAGVARSAPIAPTSYSYSPASQVLRYRRPQFIRRRQRGTRGGRQLVFAAGGVGGFARVRRRHCRRRRVEGGAATGRVADGRDDGCTYRRGGHARRPGFGLAGAAGDAGCESAELHDFIGSGVAPSVTRRACCGNLQPGRRLHDGRPSRLGAFCRRSSRAARPENVPTCLRRADRSAAGGPVRHPGCWRRRRSWEN